MMGGLLTLEPVSALACALAAQLQRSTQLLAGAAHIEVKCRGVDHHHPVRAAKRNIAEREAVACNDKEALDRCIALRELLRNNFTFALGRPHIDGPLPHAQEMRIQCGGLKGLQHALDESDEVRDVAALVALARQKFDELEGFPYSLIVQRANIVYKGR